MNREILFRGKRVNNGEWVEGCYVRLNNKAYIARIKKLQNCWRWRNALERGVKQFRTLSKMWR